MENKKVRFLVLSDLHAIIDDKFINDSHLYFKDGKCSYVDAFSDYIAGLEFDIDYVVCAGDISNKSCPKGFESGWMFLNQLREKVGAKDLICVPGNHDHQSRANEEVFSPKHNLQFIEPKFPTSCFQKNTHFWAWNWCHLEGEYFNAFLINSSAYHGYGDKEYEKGRVARETCKQIVDYISSESFSKKNFNLLLCHHHPYKMEHVDSRPDTESMEFGSHLVRELHQTGIGAWLVIHGHKHYADITYAQSSTDTPPVVLSAGSFSAKLYPEIEERTSNQFYILEIDAVNTEIENKLVGHFNTYESPYPKYWQPSTSENLPAKGGFGSDITGAKIAKDILSRVDDENPFLDDDELESFRENIENLMPLGFKELIRALENSGLYVRTESNMIAEVGLKNE